MNLPGVCIVCRNAVMWSGKRWRDPGLGKGRRHVCPQDRPTCGEMMPQARERCARRPGHGYEHRSAYALANARAS